MKYKAAEGRCILAIGPYCWGKGSTDTEAVRKATTCLPSFIWRDYTMVIVDAPDEAYVDELGRTCWPEGRESAKKLEERTFTRKH